MRVAAAPVCGVFAALGHHGARGTPGAQTAAVRAFSSTVSAMRSRTPSTASGPLWASADERPLAKEASVGRASNAGLVFAQRFTARRVVDHLRTTTSSRADGVQEPSLRVAGPLPPTAFAASEYSAAVTGLPRVGGMKMPPPKPKMGSGTLDAVADLMGRYVPAHVAKVARGVVQLRQLERDATSLEQAGELPGISVARNRIAAATSVPGSERLPSTYYYDAAGRLVVQPHSAFGSKRRAATAPAGQSTEASQQQQQQQQPSSSDAGDKYAIPVDTVRLGFARAAVEAVQNPLISKGWHEALVAELREGSGGRLSSSGAAGGMPTGSGGGGSATGTAAAAEAAVTEAWEQAASLPAAVVPGASSLAVDELHSRLSAHKKELVASIPASATRGGASSGSYSRGSGRGRR